jgi:hypothetical protein
MSAKACGRSTPEQFHEMSLTPEMIKVRQSKLWWRELNVAGISAAYGSGRSGVKARFPH